eukprot:IDg10008t1
MNPIQGATQGSYPAPTSASNAMDTQRRQYQVLEMIDTLRSEYNALLNENKGYRGLRDDLNRKIEEHVRFLRGHRSLPLSPPPCANIPPLVARRVPPGERAQRCRRGAARPRAETHYYERAIRG